MEFGSNLSATSFAPASNKLAYWNLALSRHLSLANTCTGTPSKAVVPKLFFKISYPSRRHRSTVLIFKFQAWFHHKMKYNYFKEFYNVLVFYFNTEPRLK